MPFCHGQGSTEPGGCCYVAGQVCPHHLGATELAAFIAGLGLTGARLARANALAQGVQHACGIALRLLVADPSLLTNRAAFDQAWNTHPDYVRDVRPAWAAIEQANGLTAGSYQCSSWGPAARQCCFAEDDATNAAKAAALSATAVTIRKAGGS